MHPVRALACVLTLSACSSSADPTTDPSSTSAASSSSSSSSSSTSTSTTTDPTTTGTTTNTPTDPGTTGEPACGAAGVDGCCCFSVEGDPGHGVVAIQCPATAPLCPAPVATCPGGQTDCGPDELVVTSLEGLDCVLMALADGSPGPLAWSITAEEGQAGSGHNLFVQADRTAFTYSYDYQELDYGYTAIDRLALAEPAFFADCAAAATPGERFDCLRRATVGDPIETCQDAFTGSGGR
jgi:hypothetical protein